MSQERDDALIAVVSRALRPYPWQRFTPDLLSRWVLAAVDRHELTCLLDSVPGAAVGVWTTPEPVAPDDVRVGVMVDFLKAHRWTELQLGTLCRHLLALQPGGG